jgi:hypothetical protein
MLIVVPKQTDHRGGGEDAETTDMRGLTEGIIEAAIEVHTALGPGLLRLGGRTVGSTVSFEKTASDASFSTTKTSRRPLRLGGEIIVNDGLPPETIRHSRDQPGPRRRRDGSTEPVGRCARSRIHASLLRPKSAVLRSKSAVLRPKCRIAAPGKFAGNSETSGNWQEKSRTVAID